MTILRLAGFALALLILSATALPTSAPVALLTRAGTETWKIPRMKLHMMTHHSGLPGGGGWPEDVQYKSSINFDVEMPDSISSTGSGAQSSTILGVRIVHCYADFANGTLPEGVTTCSSSVEDQRIGFRMEEYNILGPRRKELSFVLQVIRVNSDEEQQSAMVGEVPITVNDPKEPSSYLTCLLGAPFDGLRCRLKGGMSNRRELEIVAHMQAFSNDTALVTAS